MDKVEDGALARIEARYRDLVGSGNPIAQGAPARTKLPLEDRIAMRMSGITRTLTALRGGGELADYDDEWDNDVSYALEFLTEAAAEITSLRSELARKEEALREAHAELAKIDSALLRALISQKEGVE